MSGPRRRPSTSPIAHRAAWVTLVLALTVFTPFHRKTP